MKIACNSIFACTTVVAVANANPVIGPVGDTSIQPDNSIIHHPDNFQRALLDDSKPTSPIFPSGIWKRLVLIGSVASLTG
jgi:hypothetical protein